MVGTNGQSTVPAVTTAGMEKSPGPGNAQLRIARGRKSRQSLAKEIAAAKVNYLIVNFYIFTFLYVTTKIPRN